MATHWYYRIVGEEFGPVDFDTLFELAREGKLGPNDDVRADNSDDWQPAGTIVGLIPEDDPVEFSDDPSAGMDPDDDDLTSLLDAVSDDSGGVSSHRNDSSSSQWYVRVFNQELGPLEFEAVARMAEDGELAPDDAVRCGDAAEWIPAGQIVGLFHESDAPAETNSPTADAVTADAETAGAETAGAETEDDPDRIWYYRLGAEEHGPVDFGEVMELATAGTIDPATQIRAGRIGEWMDAGSVVGLFPEDESAAADAATASADDEAAAASQPTAPGRKSAGMRKRRKSRKKRRSRPSDEKKLEEDVLDWLSDDQETAESGAADRQRTPVAASPPVAQAPEAERPAETLPPVPSEASTSAAASAALTAAVNAASTPSGSSRTFTPPPKAKRGGSGGPSFRFNVSMPDLGIDPKQLGLLAVLGLVLLYVAFPFRLDPAPKYYEETKAIVDRIVPLYTSKAPASEWAAVVNEVQPRVSELTKELNELASAKNPAMQQLLAIHRDYLPPVLQGKSGTPEHVFRRVTQTLELANNYINHGAAAAARAAASQTAQVEPAAAE